MDAMDRCCHAQMACRTDGMHACIWMRPHDTRVQQARAQSAARLLASDGRRIRSLASGRGPHARGGKARRRRIGIVGGAGEASSEAKARRRQGRAAGGDGDGRCEGGGGSGAGARVCV